MDRRYRAGAHEVLVVVGLAMIGVLLAALVAFVPWPAVAAYPDVIRLDIPPGVD